MFSLFTRLILALFLLLLSLSVAIGQTYPFQGYILGCFGLIASVGILVDSWRRRKS